MIGSELQPTTTATTTRPSYDFGWTSEAYFAGDIQFWSVSFIFTIMRSGISDH